MPQKSDKDEEPSPAVPDQKSWFGSWRGTKAQPTTGTETSDVSASVPAAPQAVSGDVDHNPGEGFGMGVTAAHHSVNSAAGKGYVSWLWSSGAPSTITQADTVSPATSQTDPAAAQVDSETKQDSGAGLLSKLPTISGTSAGVWEGVAPAVAPLITEIESPAALSNSSAISRNVSGSTSTGGQPNMILPRLQDTLPTVTQPSSYTQQLYTWVSRKPPQLEAHASLDPSPPRISRAVVIGVHGFFPGAWMQKVLGPPTGTSIRFADGAAAALEAWTGERGYSCEIEKIALEGEGLIADRVDTLWTLLLKCEDQLKMADVVIIACHSQGVPVGINLMAKLIVDGIVRDQGKPPPFLIEYSDTG